MPKFRWHFFAFVPGAADGATVCALLAAASDSVIKSGDAAANPTAGLASDGEKNIKTEVSEVKGRNWLQSQAVKVPYNRLDVINRLDGFETLVSTDSFLRVTDTLGEVLVGRKVRLTWGPDTDTKNFQMLEGTIKSFDELKGTAEIETATGGRGLIPLSEIWRADIFVKTEKVATLAEKILKDNPAENNPESAGLMTQIQNRVSSLFRDLRVRDRIEFWTKWLDRLGSWQLRGERAARISDAFFIAEVTSNVRRGGSSTFDAINLVRTLFEGTETATVVLKVFPVEIDRLSALLKKDPSQTQLKAQIDRLIFQVKRAQITLGQNYTRYIWLRGTLAHMAEGKNDCSGPCMKSAARVLEAGGINDSLTTRYDTLLRGQSRPSIQDMRVLFDRDVSIVLHKLRFDTWLEFKSFWRSWIFAKPAWTGIHIVAEKIPNPVAKKWVLNVLELLADTRIRFDHLPKINKIRYGHSDAKEIKETRLSQLEELRGFSVVDSEVLVTMARVIEHEKLWAELRDLAKTEHPDFHEQMVKAETQAKVLGPVSQLHKKSIITTISQGTILLGTGIYGYYHGMFENMSSWLPSLMSLLGQ